MKKIAIITPGFLPVPAINGGAVETLINNLIDLNEISHSFKFDIITINSNFKYNYYYSNIINVSIPKVFLFLEKIINRLLKVFNINFIFHFYDILSVKKVCNSKDYDSIIIENNMYAYYFFKKIYKSHSKVLFHLHNSVGDRDKPLWLCNYISNTADKVLTVSDFLRLDFMQKTGCDRVYTFYNCIDLKQRFCNKNIYDKNENIIKFLYVGRFSKEKGLIELINAFNKLSQKHKNCKLLIVGDNSSNDKYTNIVKNKSINNENIEFLGYVNHTTIVEIYNKVDVVVIPSICNEAFGLTALEALSCFKPVIASKRGGLVEVVDNFGILVESSDFIDNLYNAMEKMIDISICKIPIT